MIPYLPEGTSELEIPIFYRHIVDNLVIRSAHHESWHTHKRDTSVCWICDLLEVSKLLINEIESYISKSALDIETILIDQGFKSEGDTVNYNFDDEGGDGFDPDSKIRDTSSKD